MSNSETPISIDEHLSALLDDETGSFEERRVIDELRDNNALSKKLSTYALIGETMRSGESEKSVQILGSSFLDGIHDQIADEESFDQILVGEASQTTASQTQAKKNPANDSSWFRPVGGFAIAASVGALAFMGLQNIGIIGNQNAPDDDFVDSSAPTAIVEIAPTTLALENEITIVAKSNDETLNDSAQTAVETSQNDQYIDANARTRSLLKRYVDSHMRYATTSAFVPSARVIAYTDNQ